MHYVDGEGRLTDVYQAPSQLVNESRIGYPQGIQAMVARALGPEGYYGAFGTHYDYTDRFADQLIDVAKASGVPLVSAQQMLTWLEERSSSRILSLVWSGDDFTFALEARPRNLQALLPYSTGQRELRGFLENSVPVAYQVEVVKGIRYARFPATRPCIEPSIARKGHRVCAEKDAGRRCPGAAGKIGNIWPGAGAARRWQVSWAAPGFPGASRWGAGWSGLSQE